ncbi:condensin-2 complex subunit D3-like [Dendronephthya gigantea]|uniref:condensin-2 complex subunit D3-like n=1 Tax=Dendronephthya gigantea TaxID=151771 RepID=UPI00106D3D23|nr:condensin-2 complex subunit D3-like [Dendronephthya gigantea]XP_028399883.1 condensin-2 complex subunit D3-like [Dendronephthya gigantea]
MPEVLAEHLERKKYYFNELKSLLKLVEEWSTCEADSQPLGFWAVLVENGMSHHSLVALLYAFLCSCNKSSSVSYKMASSVIASNIYILINQISGSGAYKIFHPLLFQKTVDILQCWPAKGNPKGKRKHAKKTNQVAGRQRKARRVNGQRSANETTSEDDSEDDDSEDSDCGSRFFDKEKITLEIRDSMIKLIRDLTRYLQSKSLKDSKDTMDHVVSLLVDLTRIEPSVVELFENIQTNSRSILKNSLNELVYKALEVIALPLQGDVGQNLRQIFRHLILNIMSTYKNASSTSGATISQEKQIVRDNAIDFVRHTVHKYEELALPAVRVLVQHLCMKVPDQAEFRNSVGKAITAILQSFPNDSLTDILSWITKYSKNSKIGYRVFALDLILKLLTDSTDGNGESRARFSHLELLRLVVARCSDRAPTVRAKALCHLAQCICSENDAITAAVKKLLTMTLTNGSMEEHSSSGLAVQEDFNVSEMIRRRVSDGKVLVRKAAIQVLESIIRMNSDALCKQDLETLHDRTMDPALSVRKQAMVSMTALLTENPESELLHGVWLDAILPLVMDRETTAQEKCLSILEEIILQNIVQERGSQNCDQVLTWNLLKLIAGISGQEMRHYFQKVCYHWAKQGKFTPAKVKAILSHTGSTNASAAWLLLSEISAFKPKLDHKKIIECFNEYTSQGNEELLCRVLKVIKNVAGDIPVNVKENLTVKLQEQLATFKCSPDVIVANMNALFKLCESLSEGDKQIDKWCGDLLKTSESYLSSVVFNPDSGDQVDEEAIVKHLFTIGEVALLCPGNTNKRLYLLVQSMIITPSQEKASANTAPVSLQRCSVSLTPTVKAHAFITLGKLCLQNETLAKDCIAALTKELEASEDPAVRNNITVVLCDLCVRYTNLVDRYIPNIARGLRDNEPLIRKQTLILLTHLLQEDYVKWKGSLFFRFITALVDEDIEIRKFADFCLVHLLLSRHPGMFHQHFIESIFHFNCFDRHKVYNQFHQTKKERELFSLKGEAKASKRMTIYKFLLDHTTDEQRFNLTGKLCQEVLGCFTDGIIELSEDSKPILKDALAILCSKNIKLSSTQVHAAEEFADEGDEAGAAMATARTKFLTQVLKKNMIENIVPIIIELKNLLEKQRSPLLKDLMLCLKEIMKDYRTEVQDVLSADRQLANEIEFDLRKFEEEQKALEKQQRERARSSSPANAAPPQRNSSLNAVGSPTRKEDFVTPQLRTPGGSVVPSASDSAPVNAPSTPKSAGRRQSLATTALMNSARKAIESAKNITAARSRLGSAGTPQTVVRTAQKSRKEAGETPKTRLDASTENGHAEPEADVKISAMKSFTTRRVNRVASTPEGDKTNISRISFLATPLSPIVNLIPVDIPRNSKGLKTKTRTEDKSEILCLPSPTQPGPKPRTWNITSPVRQESNPRKPARTSYRAKQADNSIANRTRSSRK